MTSEEIDNLQAGPELDALIAEKVMGDERGDFGTPDRGYPRFWWRNHHGTLSEKPPPYSQFIDTAWEVVEKFGIRWIIDCVPEMTIYTVRCEDENSISKMAGETLPLAICRAALKALNA